MPLVAVATAGLAHARRWGLLAALLGFAAGWTAWALSHDPSWFVGDDLDHAQRLAAVRAGLAGLVLVLGGYFLAARRLGRPLADFAAAWNRRLLLLAGAPAGILLAVPGLAERRGFVPLAVSLGLGLLAAATAAGWRDVLGERPARPRLTAAVLLVLGLGVAAALVHLGVVRHHALVSNIHDLGIFENVLWRSLHGDLLATSLFAGDTFNHQHFAPLLLALVPFYAISPRAETLIVVQVLWLCSAAVPLYLFSLRRSRSLALAFAVTFAFLVSPLVHAAALWDFHDLTLAVPLVLWALWAHDGDRRLGLALAACALLLVREEMGLVVAAFGLFAVLDARPRRGLLLLALGLAWFVLVARVFAPGTGVGAHADGLRGNLVEATSYGDLALALLANPLRLPLELLRPDKFGYLLCLGAPLLLLPACAGRLLLLLLPGAAIFVLSGNQYVADPYFHYSAFFLPAVFAAAPVGAMSLQQRFARPRTLELAAGIVVAALAFGWSFGLPGGSFRAGFHPVPTSLTETERERHAWLAELARSLPADACVAATGDVGAHLAARRCFAWFPARLDVDYLVLHREDINAKHMPLLRNLRAEQRFRTVDEQHKILVLQRNPEN
ncbi:Predicted membrane protein [Nannocystis exedens]|uniref:Predicted membrane protein n=1 Tax=Nannocystis exedens TaxID=54 RepID=A0A1I1UX35_9BACT|nr:DUF2079 domain-containing protein [Nannocystis exedens]PCC72166.1 hypothetical protein NAEX_05245 [Nannocystis exedens]SFD75371.1 Predicted membrane protein [Nannocystis exedens]